MPHRPSPVTLRVDPQAIPALATAFEEAAAEVDRQVARLRHEGHLREAWLGDETSLAVRDYYNRHVMDGAEGPYGALVAYAGELHRVHDVLRRIEDGYHRTDAAAAARWERT